MRQPNWKRWEVVLLVDMYYRLVGNSEAVADECKKLSHFLRSSNLDKAREDNTYRNTEGVKMKYQNIRHLVEGKGLSAHSRLDEEIVKLHKENIKAFEDELRQILNCI